MSALPTIRTINLAQLPVTPASPCGWCGGPVGPTPVILAGGAYCSGLHAELANQPAARPWSPDTVDVLVARVGWLDHLHPTAHIAHRPGPDGQPACAATTTGHWHRISAGQAKVQLNSPCREQACFPRGWWF